MSEFEAMATLSESIPSSGSSTAIIIPRQPKPLQISYQQLFSHVRKLQAQLAVTGIAAQAAVSIALPNSYEFIVAFLAATWQRAIAAPLNPAYKQEEFEFYIGDLKSAIVLIPKGAFDQDGPAIRAARKQGASVAECYWNGHEIALDVKLKGQTAQNGKQAAQDAKPDDIALILHTSGTTGKPKAVGRVCLDAHYQVR